MIKNLKKKAFTLVELLVVIAILAILATAGIVGYTSFTKKAQVSNDNSLVAELNNYISVATVDNDFNTVSEVRDELVPSGIDLSNLTPSAKNHGYSYAFNLKEEKFVLLDGTSLADGYSLAADTKTWDVFVLVATNAKANEFMQAGYSVYLQNGFDAAEVNASKGVDVGENNGITAINYTNTATAQDVVIRTNSAYTTLTIKGEQDTVRHYGNADVINVTAVAMASYHENGSVAVLNVKAGKVAVEANAFVGKVAVDKDATSSSVAVQNQGTIFATEVVTYNVADNGAVSVEHSDETSAIVTALEEEVTTSSDTIRVGNADALVNLSNAQSQGIVTGALNIELTADIDLTGRTWVPFGAEMAVGTTYGFSGTIDGKSHKIIGLGNGNYESIAKISQNQTTNITGYIYAFIATVQDVVTVKNITFDKVAIDANGAKVCAAVIGDTEGATNVTIFNVKVNGSINAKDKAAGLIGYAKGNTTLENCTVNIDIVAQDFRAGGLIGYISAGVHTVTINNCSTAGSIRSNSTNGKWLGVLAGGMAAQSNNFNQLHLVVTSFSTTMSVEAYASHSTYAATPFVFAEKTILVLQGAYTSSLPDNSSNFSITR